ncbi:vesicle transport through interaction with t-SNAREs homolog 1A-like [Sycon ciliatum]|uniref:vesicle transport through interaction with t-SNAREs homolog 1A-like n=1 Tax=Sycon ciliatum TaxID=27933 RepID=UPI0020AC36BE|eukprot:scpid98433/ scgid17908/ Vesicle transport through interaction with t-SNAREs homolog 1A; Vesicle transport v-SNARE protein Vti1-like 2; Vti1-rp2
MSLLRDYEQQFGVLTADAVTKINNIPNLSGKQRKNAITDVERIFEEGNDLLEQLDLEAREVPSSERQAASARVRGYHEEMTRLQKDLRRAQVAAVDMRQGREELLGNEDMQSSEDQRTRLLENTERLQKTSNRLDEGYRMALESEELGRDIMDNLHRDRETITRARDRLRGVDQDLGRSNRTLNGMIRRVYQNRVIVAFVCVLMVGVIVMGIYFAVK